MTEPDPQREQISRMLTNLANDPSAPPSTVDALSVIRAARAAAGAAPEEQPAGSDEPAESSNAVPETDEPMPTNVRQFRPRRRRTAVIALVAAASLAAVAALVVPLSLSGGSSTSTSADAERAVAASAAGDLAAAAPVPAQDQPKVAPAPAVPGISSAAAAGSRPPEPRRPVRQFRRPVPLRTLPADGFTVAADCWPALSQPVAAALGAALPAGAFGDPQPLIGDCAAAPVGGALLLGSGPVVDAAATVAAVRPRTDTALVVRIARADPGACLSADPPTGIRCAPAAGWNLPRH